jgi:1,4-dihydroxy-2-naphthoyl-CoA hydrolase
MGGALFLCSPLYFPFFSMSDSLLLKNIESFMPFSHKTKVQLHHTDAAGVLFYSKLFELMFEAFDALLDKMGASVAYIIRESDFLLPFVHTEADFFIPLFVDDEILIQIYVEKISTSSFVLLYDILRDTEKVAAAKTVHVAMDKATMKKCDVPHVIRQGLEKINSDS